MHAKTLQKNRKKNIENLMPNSSDPVMSGNTKVFTAERKYLFKVLKIPICIGVRFAILQASLVFAGRDITSN